MGVELERNYYMKKYLILLCIGTTLFGCNQEEIINATNKTQAVVPQPENNEEIPFTVKERQNEEYESIKELVEPNEIKTVTKIISTAEWEERIRVSMAHPPDYRFNLGSINYAIWVTPNKDRLEMIAEGQSKYIKLPIKESETLYKIIAEKDL